MIAAKKIKELTVKMLMEEMAEWWATGNGCLPPLLHVLETESDQTEVDGIYTSMLIKIRTDIQEKGFLSVLQSYTGFSEEEKIRYIELWLSNNTVHRSMTE